MSQRKKKPTPTPDDGKITAMLHEVDEELRDQRLRDFWKTWGSHLITGAFLIVAATAGYSVYSHSRDAKNAEQTSIVMGQQRTLAESQRSDDDFLAYQEATTTLDGNHAAVADLTRAGYLAGNSSSPERRAEAKTILASVADKDADAVLTDFAVYRNLLLRFESPAEDRGLLRADVSAAAQQKSLWQPLVRELHAMLLAEDGEFKTAQDQLALTLDQNNIPLSLRRRNQALKEAIAAQVQIAEANE